MGTATERQIGWTLGGNVAALSGVHLSGEIDVSRPQDGFRWQRSSVAPSSTAPILAVHRSVQELIGGSHADRAALWPLGTTEAYIRGYDLVASYEPAADWPFSTQLYWQAGSMRQLPGVHGSLSLLVSVQTPLLDTYPRISVASEIPPGEVLLLSRDETGGNSLETVRGARVVREPAATSCVLVRPKESEFTYAEIAVPGDFHELHLRSHDASASTEWRLFSEFLEKGVIRRARIHAVLLPRVDDVDLAAACCESAKHMELPLTT